MKSFYFWAVLACTAVGALAQDVHGHLNVGAAGQNQNDKLVFANGSDFEVNSQYVKLLTYTNATKYAGLYQGNITLTALHSVNLLGEPDPNAPAPGAFVVGQIVSVSGPEGGLFGFWETNSTTAPGLSIPTGTLNGDYRFDISESALGAGEPGGDAFGHIHGRRFTVSKPGIYRVGFRALDVSSNGAEGGPIHAPSDLLEIYFQGGVNIARVERLPEGKVGITFGAAAGYVWQLESKDDFSETTWTPVGEPVTGSDRFIAVEDGRPMASHRFYRLRAVGDGVP
jgi:hypothetical protein